MTLEVWAGRWVGGGAAWHLWRAALGRLRPAPVHPHTNLITRRRDPNEQRSKDWWHGFEQKCDC